MDGNLSKSGSEAEVCVTHASQTSSFGSTFNRSSMNCFCLGERGAWEPTAHTAVRVSSRMQRRMLLKEYILKGREDNSGVEAKKCPSFAHGITATPSWPMRLFIIPLSTTFLRG